MALKIRRTGATDYGRFTKVLICGDPGAGKTLISSTWPNCMFASAEGGLMSIASRNIAYTNIRALEDLEHLKIALDNDPETREDLFGFPVETLVVDTIDEIQRIMIRERLEEMKRDTLQLADWSYIGEHMAALVRGLRNLDMHVVFTCHLKETSDQETGRIYFKPALQGQYADQISAQVDLALLLKSYTKNEMVNNKMEKVTRRVLQTVQDANHQWIKDRSGKLPSEFEVTFVDDYQRISDLIFGQVEDLPDTKVKEVAVEVKSLDPPLDPSEAPVRQPPVRHRLPAPTPTTPRVQAEPPKPPTPEPSAQEEKKEESQEVDGVKILNPVGFELKYPLKPKPLGHGTDMYCQKCGNEVETVEKTELSRIRFRKIFCSPCFDEARR